MGRKLRGAAHRAKKRQGVQKLELEEASARQVETGHIASKPDQELFVIDTTAVPVKLEKVLNAKKNSRKGPSELDLRKIKQLVSKHDAKTLDLIANERKIKKRKIKEFDLWDEEEIVKDSSKDSAAVNNGIGMSMAGTAPKPSLVSRKRAERRKDTNAPAVQLASAGQSYHPDKVQHQDVVGEALALELRRKEIQEYNTKPLSTGMNEETRALLIDSDEEEDESDEDETEPQPLVKRKEKMTRTQRNRQKRVRAQEAEIHHKKRAKMFLNSLQEVKSISKQLDREHRDQDARRSIVAKIKQEKQRKKSNAEILKAPSLPVSLTCELSGTLRCIKPKGSLVTDRMTSLVDRNMANAKKQNKKRVIQGKKRKVRNKDLPYLLGV